MKFDFKGLAVLRPQYELDSGHLVCRLQVQVHGQDPYLYSTISLFALLGTVATYLTTSVL